MKILRGLSTNSSQPATSPFPAKNGIFFELRGGDVCHPLGSGDWFNPPYFSRIVRFFMPLAVFPFIAWRWGSRGGYFGAKCYGADNDAYRNWMKPEDVGPDSLAIMFSIRPFATVT